ncbi:MAG: hypothetical protein LBQ84_05135, partial [Flavobacteriaceae bacterium]|nr:hypothetical protein [Flavobacteriaceae bacterium]
VNLILYYSTEYGFLTSDSLNINKGENGKYPSIWFCGPNVFSNALKNGLKNKKIPLHIFHQELFEMR